MDEALLLSRLQFAWVIALHILLPALSTLLLQQPHLSVEFRRVADLDVPAEVGAGTIDIGITTRERVPAPLCSMPVPVLSTGFCILLLRSAGLWLPENTSFGNGAAASTARQSVAGNHARAGTRMLCMPGRL